MIDVADIAMSLGDRDLLLDALYEHHQEDMSWTLEDLEDDDADS